MTSLDSPQHIFVCRICGAREAGAIFCPHGPADVNVESTLTYADFEAFIATLRHPQPDTLAVWDILEREADNARTNAVAIRRAVAKWHGRRIHAAIDQASAAFGFAKAKDGL